VAEHVREYYTKYDLDGAWLDMAEPIAPECYCAECLRQIKAMGKAFEAVNNQRAQSQPGQAS